jgi:hypothetical protein
MSYNPKYSSETKPGYEKADSRDARKRNGSSIEGDK